MSWTDARDYCIAHGGHLVIIEDEYEQQFLTDLMHQYGTKNLYWIGLSGEDEQCSWVDGTPVSYTNWASGEPNSRTETVIHMYCMPTGGFSCGEWNDTLNENFVSSSSFWSTYNCGIIIEWDDPDGLGKCRITLSDGTVVELDQDPALGDVTIDTDKDGIPDVIELNRQQVNPSSGVYWTFFSNPGRKDTDGDGLLDIDDLNPRLYDTVVTADTSTYIKFNTGRKWNKIPCTAFDYYDNIFAPLDNDVKNPIPGDELNRIYHCYENNRKQSFTLNELTYIGLVNNDGAQLYMDDVSSATRETVFQRLAQRESKYFQHSGVLWWSGWKEVPKGTSGGFFKGALFSEADINFSIRIFYAYDVYDVLSTLIVIGAIIIAMIVAYYCAPVVAAHLEAILYYVETFGVIKGLDLYLALAQYYPEGIFTWIQMDMSDGDSCLDDLAATTIPIHEQGAAGQRYIEETYGGTPQKYFQTWVNGIRGGRYVDLYNNGVAYESKEGYTCLSQRVKMQILKDAWLLENGKVDKVVWVFTESTITGRVGATQSVFDLLNQYGIQYVVHLG